MNAQLEEKIKEVHSILIEKVYDVYDIFINFFGEEFVDLHICGLEDVEEYLTDGYSTDDLLSINSRSLANICRNLNNPYILVYFPHVRITNEFDRFTDINHLFVKVLVCWDGSMNGRFRLNRSEYSYLHISENYMHSHVCDIPFSDFSEFQSPCTGSGPINDTIANLSREFDADIWNLFCLELSKYVCVESVAGVPYHYLEKLGQSNGREGISDFVLVNDFYIAEEFKDMLKKFLEYFIPLKKLKFNFKNGSYSIGMSFIEYTMTISNEFIKWYNEKYKNHDYNYDLPTLLENYILTKCIITNGKIIYTSSRRNPDNYRRYIGEYVCTFKGTDYTVNVTGLDDTEGIEHTYILNISTSLYILSNILKVLNFRYGKERKCTSDSTCEKAKYI